MTGYLKTVYDEKKRPKTTYPAELASYLIKRYSIRRGSRFLDVGCGRGDFLDAFEKQGLDISGLDHESYTKDTRVRLCDLEKEAFPFREGEFDVVFTKSVIEHLFDPALFLTECKRVLKPGGRILILTPDWISQMKIFFDDYTHRQPYTTAGLKEAMEIFGFKEVQSELFYQLPVLWRVPALKIVSRFIQGVVPVTAKSSVKFIRWSVELMILG